MRLLQITDTGFSLTDFLTNNIPPYAILSHTWGPASEEVTYNDMEDGTARAKPGYAKLEFCAEQAKRDGLRFFWVDTCCIDKSNQVELGRSIVSMFRWYQRAGRCYVYLADVSAVSVGYDQSSPSWENAFRDSRWFTRGWTLQELLAPSSVEFFSHNGIRLGDKYSLGQKVHEVTGIHLTAINGDKLSGFGVEDRFKWCASRQTTEEEDTVYCLLGIFGVSMSIIYGEGVDKARQRLEQEIASSNSTSSPRQKKRPFLVAFERNSAFTGRDAELKKLRNMPTSTQQTARLAIAGLGGVGKTQLALEFVYQRQKEFTNCSVFWVPSISPEMIDQAFRDIAKQLCLPTDGLTQAKMQESLRDYWSSAESGRWILVFDNVDDIKIWEERGLIDCLPRNDLGTIVFTTRNKQVAIRLARSNVIDLSNMNEESSRQLLYNYLVSKDLLSCTDDTNVLMKQLAYLPLALVQAATYINMNSITIREYTELLNEQEEDMVELLSQDFDDAWRYRDTLNPVSATWLISFTQIQDRNPTAAEYLSLMACFDSKDIPRSLLPKRGSPKEEIDAIGVLTAYSFINRQAHNEMFTMHPLVHVATRNWLRQEGSLKMWTEQAITILTKALSNPNRNILSLWRPCMPHAYYQLQLSGGDWGCDSLFFDLNLNYAGCLNLDGRIDQGGIMLVQLMNQQKAAKGVDDPQTLTCMGDLAHFYIFQSRYDEAEALYEQCTKIYSTKHGPEHPDTLKSSIQLADVYRKTGRVSEAEASLVQTLETCKKVLGPDDEVTMACMESLSDVYIHQDKLIEGEVMLVQVLGVHLRLYGPNSPQLLQTSQALAHVYKRQDRLDKAEELLVKTLEDCTESLGHEHMVTLTVRYDLICIHMFQERLKDAEELALRGREIAEMTYGAKSTYTVSMHCVVAIIQSKQGRLTEAVDLMRSVVKTSSQLWGSQSKSLMYQRSILDICEAELRSERQSS